MRLEQRAIVRRALLQPGFEAPLVDEVDQAGFLPGVGDEERCEIGHGEALASASSLPNPSSGGTGSGGVKLTKLTLSFARESGSGPYGSLASSTRSPM